jgi:phospholipid/cholesterol/gamma-HCH transport system substrate-binding protein
VRAARSLHALVAGACAAGLVLAGCGTSLQQLPKIGGISGPTYPVRVEFSNVLNLPANAQVRRGAEVVGQVTAISVHHFVADLTLRIRRDVRLPEGTAAEVRFDNPLGEEYVVLVPPARASAPVLTSGAVIPTALTDTAPSVEDTLGALSTVLNGGGIAQLGTIIHELNQTFAGNQPQIRQLLTNIDVAVGSLSANNGAVDSALAAIENLFRQLNQGSGTIAAGIRTLAPAIGVLSSENDQFSKLLDGLSQLSTVANAVARQSGQSSVAAVKSLLPVVDQIVSVESRLAPDLADLDKFEAETPKVAPGNYLQVSVNASVDLNSAPTVATATAAAAAEVPSGPVSGAAAVTALLEGGRK